MKAKVAGFEQVFLSSGVHPLDVKEGLDLNELKRYAADPKVVAIGETGWIISMPMIPRPCSNNALSSKWHWPEKWPSL